MSRWSKLATLIGVEITLDDEGSPITSKTRKTVFCNARRIGSEDWLAARAAGLHADYEIELRSSEYGGQQLVEFDGTECQVERVRDTGEFTKLLLARRLSNA